MISHFHTGSCHCGRVTFELRGAIQFGMNCNCSICRRVGALWHGASESSLQVTTGQDVLETYQFNTMTAVHYFCKICGVHPFTRPRLDPGMWAVNLRCIDGLEIASLEVRNFDGQNWESAAMKLYGSRPNRIVPPA